MTIRKHSALVHKFVCPNTGRYEYYAEIGGQTYYCGSSYSAVSVGMFKEACGFFRTSPTQMVDEDYSNTLEARISTCQGWTHTKFIKHWTTDFNKVGGYSA